MSEIPQGARRQLLALAREAIVLELEGRALDEDRLSDPDLQPHRGAFVTLKRRTDGALRGCIGVVEPLFPLGRAVIRAALGAAFRDPRFGPVSAEEVPSLSLQVSVLSPLLPLAPTDVRVGIHGLLVRHQGRTGLLLPQVAVAEGWDGRTFLEYTCAKAGLDRKAWRDARCEILGFTAVVFGDEDAANHSRTPGLA